MAGRQAERRLAALVSADFVGYSRLMEADEAATPWGLALEAASSVHRRSIATHRKTSTASSITWTVPFDRKTNENYASKEDSR